MKNNIKRAVSLFLIVSALFSAVSCGKNGKELLESTEEELEIVKTIDGFEVPMEIYRYVALNYKASYETGTSGDVWLGESGQQLLDELNKNVDASLIKLYTTLSICDDYGVNPEDEFFTDALDIRMEEIYKSYEYEYETYINDLAMYNMTDGVYRFIVRNEILSEELINKMFEKGEIALEDGEIAAIFDTDELIRIKQILIEPDSDKTDEENLAFAETVLEKLENGAEFESLVDEYGDDLYMFNNDHGYYVTKGTYHTAFEETAYSLDIGEYSGVIKTDAGYSILKRYEKEPDYIDKYFDVLAEEYVKGQYNIILEKHETALTVTDTDKLSEYSLFNLSMNSDK